MRSPALSEPELLKRRATLAGVAAVVVALFLLSAQQTGVEAGRLVREMPTIVEFTFSLFPPDGSYLGPSIGPLLETIQIAIIATTLGAVLAIPAGFAAARNVVGNPVGYRVTRFVLSVFRTLPEVIVAAVFVAAFGLGAVAGIMALILFTFGFVAKLFSESIEAVDPGPIEAIRASGGNTVQMAAYGILPQVLPQFFSYSLYSFEVNVRIAVILGIVGAGGIGQLMMRSFQFLQYQQLAMIILVIFAAVVVIDALSTALRSRLT
jgi:phosphonate transport system permease protein